MTFEASLGGLIKAGVIKKCPSDRRAASKLLLRAAIDLRTAGRNLDHDPECTFTYSYTAMMRSGLALMFNRGYRPAAVNKHQTIVQFVFVAMNAKYQKAFEGFDLLRSKRNRFIYEPDLPCSRAEAKGALEIAKQFVQVMNEIIDLENGQSKLGFDEQKKNKNL